MLSTNYFFLLEISIQEPEITLFPKLKHYFITLNLFPSIPPSTNEFDLRNERISTRLFIVLLILLLSILLGYTSLTHVIKTKDVSVPTLSQYVYLYSKYPQTLTCPCTKISIEYGRFLRVKYTLHQVCSSIFMSDQWIAYLAHYHTDSLYLKDTFQWLATYIFQALRLFCQLCEKSISDSLIRFYSFEYVAVTVTSEQLFRSQANLLMGQFNSSTTKDFLLSMEIVRDTTQANGLYAVAGEQYVILIDPESQRTVSGLVIYDGCVCSYSAKCAKQARMYDNDKHNYSFRVPGIFSSCFAVEALLQSTLECFYNQTCINILQTYMSSLSMNVSALDSSLLSRFEQNSTIESLVDVLMVEEWNLSSVYEDYYKECQPKKCIYTYVGRNDAIYIVTTVIGLVGGLVTVLTFVIPRSVKFSPRMLKAIRRRLRFSRSESGKRIQCSLIFVCKVSWRYESLTYHPTRTSRKSLSQ